MPAHLLQHGSTLHSNTQSLQEPTLSRLCTHREALRTLTRTCAEYTVAAVGCSHRKHFSLRPFSSLKGEHVTTGSCMLTGLEGTSLCIAGRWWHTWTHTPHHTALTLWTRGYMSSCTHIHTHTHTRTYAQTNRPNIIQVGQVGLLEWRTRREDTRMAALKRALRASPLPAWVWDGLS